MRPRAFIFDPDNSYRYRIWEVLDIRGYEVFTSPVSGLCVKNLHPHDKCEKKNGCADIIFSDLKIPGDFALKAVEGQINRGCKCKHFALLNGDWNKEDLEDAGQFSCKVFEKPFTKKLLDWLDIIEKEMDTKRKLEV
ncbi:MAG: hypothetical protein MUP22_01550 [Desulfobacterales bacterium]|nr:hypothetical protein [Desulfobacterales bacterium]